jgi:mitochondrial fission protein ELM1
MLSVLIGGVNKAFKFDAEQLGNQIEAMRIGGATSGLKTTIIFSRRTPLEIEQKLRNRFQSGPIKMVDRSDRAGFEEAMANAVQYLVTPDSITMICEACSTNLPVTIFDLECANPDTSTARFVDEFMKDHRINKFGDLGRHQELEPLDDAHARTVSSATAAYNEWCNRELS